MYERKCSLSAIPQNLSLTLMNPPIQAIPKNLTLTYSPTSNPNKCMHDKRMHAHTRIVNLPKKKREQLLLNDTPFSITNLVKINLALMLKAK